MKSFILRLSALLFICCLMSCQNNFRLEKVQAKQIVIDSSLSKNDALEKFIKPYRKSLEEEMNKPLSYTKQAMFKSDHPLNTAIGNMMADAVYEMANPVFINRQQDSIDAVLLNYGGIRSGINKGVITTRTAYNIMPFENMVVVAELDADAIKDMMNYLAKNQTAHPISNMQLAIDEDGKVINYSIDGRAIKDDKTYLIATSDYLLQGGDNMNFFKEAKQVYNIDYKLRNLFIDFFIKKDSIQSKADQRFIKVN